MKETHNTEVAPKGCSVLSPYLLIESVEEQIEFLVKVFDAVITNDSNKANGFIQHGEIRIGDTTVMMGRSSDKFPPRESMNYVYVASTDETHRKALTQGATEIMAPADRDYGNRESGFTDKFGNQWWVAEILKPAK